LPFSEEPIPIRKPDMNTTQVLDTIATKAQPDELRDVTVLQFCSFAVLQFCSFAVLQFCSFAVLQF
jgi:hypothetical protein